MIWLPKFRHDFIPAAMLGVPRPSANPDPHFANVKALLHFDGADAGTTFTDVIGHTFTGAGNAQIDTAQSKFGGASLLCDGAGDSVFSNDSADFELGGSDFTLECWVRFAALTGINLATPFISKWATGALSYFFGTFNQAGTRRLIFAYSTNGTSQTNIILTWVPVIDTWYFVQGIRSSTTFKFAVDGVQVGTDQAIAGTFHDNATALRLGNAATAGNDALNGWIDDARITVGVARAIELPTSAFPDS